MGYTMPKRPTHTPSLRGVQTGAVFVQGFIALASCSDAVADTSRVDEPVILNTSITRQHPAGDLGVQRTQPPDSTAIQHAAFLAMLAPGSPTYLPLAESGDSGQQVLVASPTPAALMTGNREEMPAPQTRREASVYAMPIAIVESTRSMFQSLSSSEHRRLALDPASLFGSPRLAGPGELLDEMPSFFTHRMGGTLTLGERTAIGGGYEALNPLKERLADAGTFGAGLGSGDRHVEEIDMHGVFKAVEEGPLTLSLLGGLYLQSSEGNFALGGPNLQYRQHIGATMFIGAAGKLALDDSISLTGSTRVGIAPLGGGLDRYRDLRLGGEIIIEPGSTFSIEYRRGVGRLRAGDEALGPGSSLQRNHLTLEWRLEF